MKLLLVPILAAVAQATALLVAKFILTRRSVSIRDFNPLAFWFLCGFACLLLPFLGEVNLTLALQPSSLLLIGSMIVVAAGWNMLYYAGIKGEKVNITESILIFMPITTIVLAGVIYPDRFDARIGFGVQPVRGVQADLVVLRRVGG